MLSHLELIVFDLAGTTVSDNQDVAWVLQETMQAYGVYISMEESAAVMGLPKPVAIKLLLESGRPGQQVNDDLVLHIHERFVERMCTFYRDNTGVSEMEDASYVFSRLRKAGIKVAIDTGFDRTITTALLERMGWLQQNLIAASVTSDEVKNGRPHPDMIFRAMQLTGVSEVSRVGKVGDTASDLLEGTAAGCALVVGVTTGAYSRENLSLYPHHYLIDRLSDLLPIVGL